MSEGRKFFEEWKARRREQSGGLEQEKAAEEAAWAQALGSERGLGSEEEGEIQPLRPEDFQWTEERDRAIQHLLETTAPGTRPSVHLQLQSIQAALLAGKLEKARSHSLLDEVDAYLSEMISNDRNRPSIDHEAIVSAREEKEKAFAAWQEASNSLRQYLENGDKVFLEVAAYAADQGSGFLSAARRQLLECEPEPDPEWEEE